MAQVTYHAGNVIGFDTNHAGDRWHPDSPTAQDCPCPFSGRIWEWDEVKQELTNLAQQAEQQQ